MNNFQYVPKREYQPLKVELIKLINRVQDEVRDNFTFQYEFIGSASRNMITRDASSNKGYDFDVNIFINDDDNRYTPSQLRQILKNGFDKHVKEFQYDYAEDSKRVLTIKVKDTARSRILHSCDFAIVNDYQDNRGKWHQEFVFFNKKQNTYEWQEQPEGFYLLPEKIDWIKECGLWNEVRELYLIRKNKETNPNKKSRSIFAETIAAIYNEHR